MKLRKNLLKSASIIGYIMAVLHVFLAAWFFATEPYNAQMGILSSTVSYILIGLFMCAMLGSLYTGFYFMDYKNNPREKESVMFWVCFGICCLINPIGAVLALISVFKKSPNANHEDVSVEITIHDTKPLTEEEKAQKHKKTKRNMLICLAVSLALVFVGSFGAMAFHTSFFSVRVNNITLPVNDGQWVSADLYKPETATEENKAPVIVVVPGFTRTKETMAQYCIELSRRGAVVIAIDPSAQGDSSSSHARQAATEEGYGCFAVIKYLYETDVFNYIDKSRISAMGHSAGGNAVHKAALKFSQDNTWESNPLKAIYVSGYLKDFKQADAASYRCNVGYSYALYDEGAYRNYNRKNGNTTYPDADFVHAQEGLWLVNNINGLNTGNETEAQMDVVYGSPYNGTMRILHNEPVNHCFQPYDSLSIANIIEFFEVANILDETQLSPSDQIWWGKEICNLIALIGALMFIVPFAWLLLQIPFFKSIKKEEVEKLPKQTARSKMLFWTTFVVSAVIACLDFIPLARLSIDLFPDAHSGVLTWIFPARMVNAVVLWAIVNGIVGLLIFFGTYLFYGRKHGVKTQMTSLKISGKDLGKTLLLGALVFGAFYLLVEICYFFFHNDFRFMMISARILNPQMLLVCLMYIPLFFIFYLSNSIRVNLSNRIKNWPEWVVMLVSGLANTVGLFFILVIQYFAFAYCGLPYWTNYGGQDVWLFINMVFALIPMMFLLPIYNRIFYKMTNRVYLGPIITCMIFVTMTITASVVYFPII